MQYRPEIDGLRAVAVIPVILFHAGFESFKGGFVGVDIFFVISGYLITSIILSEMDQGKFSLIKFYERRVRRILPALFFVTIVCIPFAWFLMYPDDFQEFGQSIIGATTFSSNIYFSMKRGYFNTDSELKPLLHTWTLSVEEQYYILFPLFLMLAWHWGKPKIISLLILCSIVSLAVAHWGAYHNTKVNFLMLYSRGWELLLGALVAFYFNRAGQVAFSKLKSQTFSLLGLAMIMFSIFAYTDKTPFPSLYATVPTFGTLLIILFTQPGTLLYSLLSNRVLVGIGLISYSAYLWHQPILAFARIYVIGELELHHVVIAITLTLLLAYLTKKLVEDPIRFKLFKNKPKPLFFSALLISIVLISFGLFLHITKGIPERAGFGKNFYHNYGLSDTCYSGKFLDKKCRSSENPSVMVWGDSFAMHLSRAVDKAYSEKGILQATLAACPPIIGFEEAKTTGAITCKEFNQKIFDYLNSPIGEKINTVILSSSFSITEYPQSANQFNQTLQQLKNSKRKVVVIGPTPINKNTIRCIKLGMREKTSLTECEFDRTSIVNQNKIDLISKAAEEVGVQFIDLTKALCSDGTCRVIHDDRILFRDNGHLSNDSTTFISDFIKKQITNNQTN